MGLLKRLFSIGSKKNKKDRPPIVHNIPVPELPWSVVSSGALPIAVNEEEHEAAVGRLLRSSSARFAQSSELDYALLPPLPHPINNVVNPPASSTISLASSTISQRSTYNVTVHKRRRHTPVEEPVPSMPNSSDKNNKRTSLAEDDSRVLRLRSDPSVASLLELYDEHGKVAADAFSNDTPARSLQPPKEGRTQVQRNGSTLRQLLGAQPSIYSHDGDNSDSGEGDISWAERFLAESEATESSTSLTLQTPVTPKHTYTMPLKADISCTTDADASVGTIDNPAISSMEVEVSLDIDDDISQGIHDDILGKLGNSPYMHVNPSTPQRASQIFDFLTKKQSTAPANLDRTLPELPSCFSTPSEENEKINYNFNDPPPFTFAPTRVSTLLPSVAENTPKQARTLPHSISLERTPSAFTYRDTYGGPRSTFSDDSHSSHQPITSIQVHQDPQDKHDVQGVKVNDVKIIMTGPTKVIVTAATPSAAHDNAPTRILRGPRALPSKSSGSIKRRRSALVELSNASSTSVSDSAAKVISGPKRQQPTNRRSSVSSVSSQSREDRPSSRTRHHKQDIVAPLVGQHKENQLGLSVKLELPSTPLRSNSHSSGSKALLRTVVHQAIFNPPSPASSSELSPVGRQMMMDVRQQRMYAREVDRERAAKRSKSERTQRV